VTLASLRDVRDLAWPPQAEREQSYQVLLDDALRIEGGASCTQLSELFIDYNRTAFQVAFSRTAMGRWFKQANIPYKACPTEPWGGTRVLIETNSVADHVMFKKAWA
jgi:hypothetical protein